MCWDKNFGLTHGGRVAIIRSKISNDLRVDKTHAHVASARRDDVISFCKAGEYELFASEVCFYAGREWDYGY